MTKVLILGANGQLARNTTRFFLSHADVHLTLYLRRANRLRNPDPSRVTIVEGDVTDRHALTAAIRSLGTPVPDDRFIPSDLVVPFADATLDETRRLLAEGAAGPANG